MGTVLVNYSGKTRRATLNGREYIVARCTLIVPGVLNGSKGALYYPPDEVAKNHDAWNGIPLTKGHPSLNGANVSARSPEILQSHGLGHVFNVGIAKGGRLRGEAWFDVKSCERVAPEVLNKLKSHEPIELSTGLFTNDRLAENGAHHNGKKYTHVARDYRPDHLAILLDQVGACLLPGQRVEGRFIKGSKARYSGEAVRIETASGEVLSVTANHPIATRKGFVPAGELAEGEDLLHYVGEHEALAANTYEQNAPALVEDVFDSLKGAGRFAKSVNRRASTLDFHGDAAFFEGDVEIVSAQRALSNNGVPQSPQRFGEGGLGRGCDTQAELARSGHFLKVFDSVNPTDVVSVGNGGESLALCGGELGVHQFGGLRVGSGQPPLAEFDVEDRIGDSELSGDTVNVFSRDVGGDSGLDSLGREAFDMNPLLANARVFGSGAELDISLAELGANRANVDPVENGQVLNRISRFVGSDPRVDHGFGDGSFDAENLSSLQGFSNRSDGSAELFRQLLDRFPGKVLTDKIVRIDRFIHDGPVYDFETTTGYMVAEKLIVSNCSLRDGCGVLTDNCGGKGGKPGPCPSGVLADHLTAEKIHDPQEFRTAYSNLDDADKKAVVKALAKRGLIHPVDAKKRGVMTASEIIKSAGAQYQKAKLDHEMVPTNRHVPFQDSEVFKRMAGTTDNTACVLNASNVCINCGGPGSGKPGPCPDRAKTSPNPTPISVDREQAARAHKLGTDATDTTSKLLTLGVMGQMPNAASRNALTPVMDSTRRANKRAVLGSANNVGQTSKAVVQAQKAHEKASRTLLDAAQSDPGAAYEMRKAAAKHDLAAKSFGEMAARMKLTGNAMHELNGAGFCVNCGGPGSGKPGPCPTFAGIRSRKRLRERTAERDSAISDKLEKTSFEIADLPPGKKKVIEGRTVEKGKSDSDIRVDGERVSNPDSAARLIHGLKANSKLNEGDAVHELNDAGFCVNCGGKGGKPGPCPTGDSGDDVASLKKQISDHKKDMKARGIRVTSFMNGGLTADESRANAKLFDLKTKLEGATKKGAGSATHVKEFLKTHDVTPEGFSAFGPQTKKAVVEKYNAANKTKLSVDDFHNLTNNSHSGDDMATKKEKMVQFLTANCDCWKGEKDAEILSNFDEEKLKALVAATKRATENGAALDEIREGFGAEAEGLTANAMPAFVKGKSAFARSPSDEEEAAEGEAEPMTDDMVPAKKGKKKMAKILGNAEEPAKPPTLNEWLATAPVEVQEVIRTAQAVETGAKEKIVKTLVGNSSAKSKADRETLAKFLMSKPLAELNTLSKLSVNRAAPAERDPMDFLHAPAKKSAPVANYGGMEEDFEDDEITGNEDTWLDAPLTVPTVNWAEEAKLIPTGARRTR